MTAAPMQALIFDVDGTIADTERAHLAAFNHAFAEAGLDWHWDEALYTRLLEISGGKERILHYWRTTRGEIVDVSGSAVSETVQRLHDLKTAAYETMVNSGGVQLRPGVLELMEEARTRGLGLAIATTTSPVNIAALLRKAIGPHWRLNFSVDRRRLQRAGQETRSPGLPAGAAGDEAARPRLPGLRGFRQRPARRDGRRHRHRDHPDAFHGAP